MAKSKNSKLLKAADFENALDGFASDTERIKYITKHYGDMDIAKAFSLFYGVDVDGADDTIEVTNIEIGKCYYGTVKKIDRNGIEFDIPGVKDEIISKENFNDCLDNIHNYLITHDYKLYFEVRGYEHGKFVVSVVNGYYNLWKSYIEQASRNNTVINVHIDELTKGGYLCHTPITTINELTGKSYIHSVFIPGSNIVLNIENDFERWVNKDVQIIPQKFVKYRKDLVNNLEETSLIGSRKRALQIIGSEKIYEIYTNDQLLKKSSNYTPATYAGKVTGIINSNKKCGVFVELDEVITGLLPLTPNKLLDFKPGDDVKVQVAEFEVKDGKDNFVFNKAGKLTWCNTRLVFKLA